MYCTTSLGTRLYVLVYLCVTGIIHFYVSSTTQPLDEASSPVYGNVDSQLPVPPRQGRSIPLPSKQSDGPPLPPRTRHDNGQPSRRKKASNGGDRRAYFSKIFNGCPLHLNCASAWVHPITNCELEPSSLVPRLPQYIFAFRENLGTRLATKYNVD